MSFTEVGGTDLQILPETGIGSLDTGFRLLYEHDLLVGDELSSAKIPIETSLFDGEMADGLVECLFIRLSDKTVSSVKRDGATDKRTSRILRCALAASSKACTDAFSCRIAMASSES